MTKFIDGNAAPLLTTPAAQTTSPDTPLPEPSYIGTDVARPLLLPATTQAKAKALARKILARQQRDDDYGRVANGSGPQRSPAPEDRQAWLTPKPVLTTVMAALGISAFTIDAASNGPGTSNVTALTHFTKDDAEGGGLMRRWLGSVVWFNPPYKFILPWVVKAREAVQQGDARLVIGLLPANVGAKWYHENIVGHAHVLFLRGRLYFDAKPGRPCGPAKDSSMLVIWGGTADQVRRLAAAFPTAEHKPLPGWVAACTLPLVEPPVAAPVVEADSATACIELFAGGGSVHLAMREAGYTTVFANDFCPGKRASYAVNFPNVPLDGRDVRAVRGHDLPPAAVLTASSPCTDHSTNGRRAGFAGEHGPLAFKVVRLIGEMRAAGRAPRVVAFETCSVCSRSTRGASLQHSSRRSLPKAILLARS